MPIRLMHFADTHFGVESYGRLDPATGLNTRLIDFRETLFRAIDTAIEEDVQLALFAGDAYKSRDPSQTQQREFAHCIRRLTDRGIPVVMLTGNHDIPNVRGRAHAMEIYRALGVEGVHIIQKPEVIKVTTPAGVVQIAALPYLMKGFILARDESQGCTADEIRQLMEQRYSQYLDDLVSQLDASLPTVLMGHFWVRNATLSSWQQGYFNVNEPQVSLSDLARPEFDYVALGHIHKFQDLNRHSKPPVVYSGSPDYIDFGERMEKKGYVLVDLAKGETTCDFVEIGGSRRLVEIQVDADTETPTETILKEIGRHQIRENIVRLTYKLPAERLPFIREQEIREALTPAFLVVSVRADVQRDQATRSRFLTESLDPLSALTQYLECSEQGKRRAPELLPYAHLLLDDLRREDAVR